mgnify:CR=1 FL=1
MRTDFPDKLSFRDYLFSAPSFSYFSSLPTLETPRLLLRKIRLRDAADVFAYASDPKVAQYVLWEPHHDLRETRGYIRAIRRQYRQGLPSSWAIELKSEQKVIGSIGYMWVSSENRSAEIGYSLSRDHWNQGFASEALQRVLQSAFLSPAYTTLSLGIDWMPKPWSWLQRNSATRWNSSLPSSPKK